MNQIKICIPVYYREDKVKTCLETLRSTDVSGLDVEVLIAVNGCSDEFVPYLKSLHPWAKIWFPGENIGKPKAINYLAQGTWDGLLVSLDSDLETTDRLWLKKMTRIFFEQGRALKLGALGVNYTGKSPHVEFQYKPRHCTINTTQGAFTMMSEESNLGIGGGVLMTPRNVWNQIGGYSDKKVYGDDDGNYFKDCHTRGLSVAYPKEIYFHHPDETDLGYTEWKSAVAHGKIDGKEGYFEAGE
jgi:GT2 family glycosyltransferase